MPSTPAGMMRSQSAPNPPSRATADSGSNDVRSPEPKRTKRASGSGDGLRGMLEAEVLRSVFGLAFRKPARPDAAVEYRPRSHELGEVRQLSQRRGSLQVWRRIAHSASHPLLPGGNAAKMTTGSGKGGRGGPCCGP